MNRSLALSLLAPHRIVLADRFGVTTLALFGSTARGSAGSASDVDVLVAFDGPATSARFFGVPGRLARLRSRFGDRKGAAPGIAADDPKRGSVCLMRPLHRRRASGGFTLMT